MTPGQRDRLAGLTVHPSSWSTSINVSLMFSRQDVLTFMRDFTVAESTLVNRNITASGKRTSMRLEPDLWDGLQEICRRERTDVSAQVRRIHADSRGGRTSAVRVFVLRYFRDAATDEGHRLAGHGTLPEMNGNASHGGATAS